MFLEEISLGSFGIFLIRSIDEIRNLCTLNVLHCIPLIYFGCSTFSLLLRFLNFGYSFEFIEGLVLCCSFTNSFGDTSAKALGTNSGLYDGFCFFDLLRVCTVVVRSLNIIHHVSESLAFLILSILPKIKSYDGLSKHQARTIPENNCKSISASDICTFATQPSFEFVQSSVLVLQDISR